MGKEIERKFLVDPRKFVPGKDKVLIKQGYLSDDPERIVRIRVTGSSAILTIKGKTSGITRDEFNYPVPMGDAEILLSLSKNTVISKTRYFENVAGKRWEIDWFTGANEGLLMAEIELGSEDEHFILPRWILKEVSDDHRYYNSYLSQSPYKNWQDC